MKNDENKYEFIGSQIKKAREADGMSQQELAEILGYDSATAISLIEAGKRKVAAEDLVKIAQNLHNPVEFFLGIETPKHDLRIALRADKDLGEKDEKEILNFIEYVKNKKRGDKN